MPIVALQESDASLQRAMNFVLRSALAARPGTQTSETRN
jgi:hypothetical protein